ncbi:MAG: ABC transporter ATP-binding protein [Bacillota bacterium]
MPAREKNTSWQLVKKALARALPKIWWALLMMIAVATASFFLSLLPPLLLRRLVDQHLKSGIATGLWAVAVYYLAAYLATSLFDFLQSLLTTLIGQNMLLQLRLLLVEQLSRLPIGYFSRTPVGEIISRATSDVDAVANLFSSGLFNSLTDLFRMGGVLVGMYLISPPLFLLSLLVIPPIYLLSGWFRENMFEAEMQIRRSVGRINAFIQEILSGLKVIKAFGVEHAYTKRFQQPLIENVQVSNTAAFYVSAFPCVMQVLRAVIIAIVIWFGARTSLTDRLAISVGGLAAMVDLLGRLLDPVEAIANEVQVLQQAFAGLARITELMLVPSEEKAPMEHLDQNPNWQHAAEAISLQGVHFGYADSSPVVEGITLTVRRGQRVALVGRTGAGKTTLMSLIAGLYAPWAGSVQVCGINPHSLDPRDRRRLIGVVPQQAAIFEGTVRDNITLMDDSLPEEWVLKAAELVGLHEHILQMPQGYQTVLGAGGAKLSYGQTQLLSIARAIVCNPPVLLLDEPTSGMDTLTEEHVFTALRSASADRTIITISHRLSGIIDADMVHVLANGHMVQSGSPEELAGQRGWYSVFKQLEDLGWVMR